MRKPNRGSGLYSHQEEDHPEDSWDPESYSVPPPPSSSSSASRSKQRYRNTLNSRLPPGPSGSSHAQKTDLYSQWIQRYRSSANTLDDPRDDPDSHYFHRNVDQLQDTGDSDEEDPSRLGVDGGLDHLLDSDPIEPASQTDKERLEWQAMLASVLSGDVLKSEKRRIASVIESGNEKKQIGQMLWLSIRAKFSGRSEEEEKTKLEERRLRVVDSILDQIKHFVVQPPDPNETQHDAALRQVTLLLHRLDIAHSLYPNTKEFAKARPHTLDPSFQSRIDALHTWCNVMNGLRYHLRFLQRWTGSETLDVTAHNTSSEIPLTVNTSSTSSDTQEVADPSSFIERLLKEETMQRTFEKGALFTIHNFLTTLRESQINLFPLFQEMKLPAFEKELVPLLSFPCKLAQGSLLFRIQYAQRLGFRPDNLIIDQTLEDLKVSIGLNCTLKRQYEDCSKPDPEGRWDVPPCLAEDYDSTILEGLKCLFTIISAKLRIGKKAIYFKETELLESYWGTFNDISLTASGGSRIVAEQLCSLINRLMVRVTNYFDSQVRVPTSQGLSEGQTEPQTDALAPGASVISGGSDSSRQMTDDQMVTWYHRILDSVRLRYRKLQRFTRVLTQTFGNSAEYSLDDVSVEQFVRTLDETGHFLVLTNSYEEDGLYLAASGSLLNDPNRITQILTEAFHPKDHHRRDTASRRESSEDEEEDYEEAEYVLVFSPQTHFVWKGQFIKHDMEMVDLEMKENRVRLIANGSDRQLSLAKNAFTDIFLPLDENDDYLHSSMGPLTCFTQQKAHLPIVNRELRKIARSTNKLAELIVDSVHTVRHSLRSSTGCQDLLENWYLFASDHGNHALKSMDQNAIPRFSRLLIKLAISWLTFICDDCDPNDRKTFKLAVNALEFTLYRTKRSILQLPDEQFEMLRQKVSNCMTLLISHFDILGARSTFQANQEKERQEELMRSCVTQHEDLEDVDEDLTPATGDIFAYVDSSTRLFWNRLCNVVESLEDERFNISLHNRVIGRVLDNNKPEDRSLVFLANFSSNVSIRWQQGRFIGSGAFGSVYMAVNLDSGSIMAVKEVKFQALAGAPNLHAQIKDELRVMEILHHPNVVEYYGIEVHRDKVYIFEEYCQGGSLAALLEHGRIEDERIIQVYTMQMLEGLAYLHSQGVVHRDIKPDNILLDHLGVLKFVDFGAAKIFSRNTRTIQRSRRMSTDTPLLQLDHFAGANGNSLTGTPMYMSPEVIKNDISGRFGAMDIWSLGCVVLEFVTGKKPWSNLDNEWAIMFHIGVAVQHPPLPEPGQIGDMGINFLKSCLTINAHKRPSASELMDHAWMIDFKEALAVLEATENQNATAEQLAVDETFEHATVARQAVIQGEKEKEIEDSPSDEYFSTPSLESTDLDDPGQSP